MLMIALFDHDHGRFYGQSKNFLGCVSLHVPTGTSVCRSACLPLCVSTSVSPTATDRTHCFRASSYLLVFLLVPVPPGLQWYDLEFNSKYSNEVYAIKGRILVQVQVPEEETPETPALEP
jgi:hypothetical protein